MIRLYHPQDAAHVERLISELQEFERTLEPSRVEGTPQFAKEALARMLKRRDERQGRVFVADADGIVIGFTCVLLNGLSPITTITSAAYIAELVVAQTHRRQGVGRSLLRAAEEYAIEQNVFTLRLDVLAANSGARALYYSSGLRDFEISLTKELTSAE